MNSSRKIVGAPLNFRGLVYSPVNEQGVVYLFGLMANALNIRVESIQQGYPDCTAIRYVGKGRWERIDIEFEYKSSNFDHDPDHCDVLVCWEDDLEGDRRNLLKGLQIYELRSVINTPEVPNILPRDPEKSADRKAIYNLESHFRRKNVSKRIQALYLKLDKEIRSVDGSIWLKYAQTAVTYYSPQKVFVFLRFGKNSLSVSMFTDQKAIKGVQNIGGRENWGKLRLTDESQLPSAIAAVRESFEIMREAVKENRNTGWHALKKRQPIDQ